MNRLRVALLYNAKPSPDSKPTTAYGVVADATAEYDSPETIEAIDAALSSRGHQVLQLEADTTLLDTLRDHRPDICFNIAEGCRGRAREAQVPALLEMLRIPYTGSGVLTHAISLDKGIAKRIWQSYGLPTARFQVFRHVDDPLEASLPFPLLVKPLSEGSGMGIDGHARVTDRADLHQRVEYIIRSYHQPALVEEYLPGREFTVGLIGNRLAPGARPLSPLYDSRGYHLFPVLEIDASACAETGLYGSTAKSFVPGEPGAPAYLCPADIDRGLEHELKRLALLAFEALDGADVSRVDFRLDAIGRPQLLEINTLPGLNPVVSDLCIMAQADGMPYDELINAILDGAIERYGLAWERAARSTRQGLPAA
jgi:D-alanine-D-alanine ligase